MNHSNSFSLESFEFTGSIVPIASYFMVRSQFYNGAIHLTYWNYISSIFFFFLSLILPFIHTLYFFISIDNLEADFFNKKRFQLLQQYEQYIIS
ncbi:hypothetical protein L6452_32747 [Arctium lappa]|uniref:Uncharacterized protein n=1 Tax=Arctium lappa TaxID=4217 RepID=A0ACB8Z5U5_ARCLA|nr:hypothetical protein L6452_32747 [Arctium lappa]